MSPSRTRELIAEDRGRFLGEMTTMALYLAIVLYAALIALPEEDRLTPAVAIATIWGSAIGLAAAHVFAFEISARLVAAGGATQTEKLLGGAQLSAAFVVALAASIPLVVMEDKNVGHDVAEAVLALIIGGTVFTTARRAGAGGPRSLLYGGAMLLTAGLIIFFKVSVGH